MPHDFASVPYEDRAKEIPFASAEYIAFASRSSFLGVPAKTLDDLGDGQVVILGAPFDWGASYRPGARFGPQAIRDADYGVMDGYRPHLPTGIDPLRTLGVVDIGDVYVVPGQVELSLERIIATVEKVTAAGKIPVVLGGDHTVTFANATGVTNVLGAGEIAVVHFDAHADTGVSQNGTLYGHGTPMRRLIESGAVPGPRFVQIGLRGYWPEPEVMAWMKEQGMRSYLMNEIEERGLKTVVDEAVEYSIAGGAKGVFISIDIDVVDPGFAPGTGTPEPGGLTSRQLMDTVRRLARELPVVGADVVEVAPGYDGPGEITAYLANRIVLELLNGLAEKSSSGV
ncbi:MAG: agmatinase [Actinobacteria bacterium]|nr:agmatinase [Acidimicrobiia bacterium]MCA1734836.1 agmatinase [Actinomycetota bacterium]MDQ3501371.1 agmatinase [Actinomycetota bacterium]